MTRTTRYDHRWSFADRLGAVLVLLGMLATLAWFLLPSTLFIRTVAMDVKGATVRFVRELPFGTVDARWRAEITLIDGGGFECNSGAWVTATYQPVQGNTVTYQLGDWADDCVDAGPPFYLTTTRQVMLFGVIPLRQDTDVTEIEGTRPPGPIVVIPREG